MEVGRYVLAEALAPETLGPVWRATDRDGARVVRLKRLRPEHVGDDEKSRRFEREAELAALVRHPAVLALVEHGVDADGIPWMAYEDLPGARPLAAVLAQGPLEPQRAALIGIGLGRALAAAHREGVVHRNLGPHTVLVGPDDEPRLHDFGLATRVGDVDAPTSLTRDEARIGNAAAMSPEYVSDAVVSTRGDVYALGVLLFQMLTGRPPFDGRAALGAKLVERAPRASKVAPGLPEWVDPLLAAMLAARPDERPELDEVVARLERELRTAVREAELPGSRRTVGVVGAVAAVAAITSVLVFLVTLLT